jgi:hypothetical protein
MSKKALLIGVAVIVLALGGIGAAFATGMTFSNIGALSSGEAKVVQINTDHVGYLSADDGSGVDGVVLSFTRDLTAGSTIWVTIEIHGPPKAEAHGWTVLDYFLYKDWEVTVPLAPTLEVDDIDKVEKVTVTVAER